MSLSVAALPAAAGLGLGAAGPALPVGHAFGPVFTLVVGGDLDPEARASFLADPLDQRHLSRASALDENSGGLSLGLRLPVNDQLNFEAALSGSAGSETRSCDGSLSLSYTW